MSVLKVLSPKRIPNNKSDWNWHVRSYHCIILKLLSVYKRCAISDTINLGETQIIHNVRDYWYEQELQRFNIDTSLHIEKQYLPWGKARKNHRSWFFKWSESLLVFHEGESYNIKRADRFVIETEIYGQLSISTEKDIILRSEFIANNNQPHKASSPQTDDNAKEQQNERDVTPEKKSSAEPHATTYRGFEENNIF